MSPINMASVSAAQSAGRNTLLIGHQASGYNSFSKNLGSDIYHINYGAIRRYAPNGTVKWSKSVASGVNTTLSTKKIACRDVRGIVPNPRNYVGPWNMSSVEPDMNIKTGALC